jgi:hypothetical protein
MPERADCHDDGRPVAGGAVPLLPERKATRPFWTMRRRLRICAAGMILLSASCRPEWAPDPGPGPAALDWRSLVGCYRDDTWRFSLDSVPFVTRFDNGTNRAGARRGVSSTRRASDVYWYLTGRNTVVLVMDDHLHKTTAEFVVRGDSLIGRAWSNTDVSRGPALPYAFEAVRDPCGNGIDQSDGF